MSCPRSRRHTASRSGNNDNLSLVGSMGSTTWQSYWSCATKTCEKVGPHPSLQIGQLRASFAFFQWKFNAYPDSATFIRTSTPGALTFVRVVAIARVLLYLSTLMGLPW